MVLKVDMIMIMKSHHECGDFHKPIKKNILQFPIILVSQEKSVHLKQCYNLFTLHRLSLRLQQTHFTVQILKTQFSLSHFQTPKEPVYCIGEVPREISHTWNFMITYYDHTITVGSSNWLATLSGKQEGEVPQRKKCANMLGRVIMCVNEAEKQHAWLIMNITALREDLPGHVCS